MVKDDDQKTAGSSIAEGDVEQGVENAVEDPDKVVKQQTSLSNASQPGEPEQDEEAEEAQEEEQDKFAEDLHTLEEELDKISVSAPTVYVVLDFCFADLEIKHGVEGQIFLRVHGYACLRKLIHCIYIFY